MRNLKQEACAFVGKLKAHKSEILTDALNECDWSHLLDEVVQEFKLNDEEKLVIDELGRNLVRNWYFVAQFKEDQKVIKE